MPVPVRNLLAKAGLFLLVFATTQLFIPLNVATAEHLTPSYQLGASAEPAMLFQPAENADSFADFLPAASVVNHLPYDHAPLDGKEPIPEPVSTDVSSSHSSDFESTTVEQIPLASQGDQAIQLGDNVLVVIEDGTFPAGAVFTFENKGRANVADKDVLNSDYSTRNLLQFEIEVMLNSEKIEEFSKPVRIVVDMREYFAETGSSELGAFRLAYQDENDPNTWHV